MKEGIWAGGATRLLLGVGGRCSVLSSHLLGLLFEVLSQTLENIPPRFLLKLLPAFPPIPSLTIFSQPKSAP